MKDALIVKGVQLILEGLEVNTKDRDYLKTPWRVLETYKEMFDGKKVFPSVFEEEYDEMIVMRGHHAWTMCPHHLLPVHLEISIGYVPKGKVVGLSKMARIADFCLSAPSKQEKLTHDIADAMMNMITPAPVGAGVVVEGSHLCMRMRGVKTQGKVLTSAMRGVFLDKPEARAEFLGLVRNHT